MADLAQAERLESEIERIGRTDFTRADIDELLAAVGQRLGLERLVLDEDGIAALTVADDIALFVSYQPGFPGLLAMAPLPDGSPLRAPLLRRLLVANLSGAVGGGAAFSLMPPDDTLLLSWRIDLSHRDAGRFADALLAFADSASHWRAEIELFADLAEQDDDEAGAGADSAAVASGPPASTMLRA